MNELAGAAKYFGMASDAIDSRTGTVSGTESLPTLSPGATVAQTSPAMSSGHVRRATDKETTPARSSPLNDEQATFLSRIKRTRKAGMLPSLEEIDILIGIVEELTK